jgi:hypothetical protein
MNIFNKYIDIVDMSLNITYIVYCKYKAII